MTELDEEEIQKITWQFGAKVRELLAPLEKYGQQGYANAVVPEIEKLAWQMHWRLEGLDIPYDIDIPHW